MPNVTPMQADFSIGEVAPDVQFRSTLEARSRGVQTLTNFVTDARGPVIRRNGFRFLGEVGKAGPTEPLTPCDPDTLTYDQQWQANTAETANETGYSGFRFSPDGLTLYMPSPTTFGRGRGFYTWRLTSPFDLDTVQTFSYPSDFYEYVPPFGGYAGSAPTDLYFNLIDTSFGVPAGGYVFTTDGESADSGGGGGTDPRVLVLQTVTPWEMAGALEVASLVLDSALVGSHDPVGIELSTDGKYFYIWMNDSSKRLFQYEMAIPFNISTAIFLRVTVVPIPVGTTFFIKGIRFDPTGLKMHMTGDFQNIWTFDMSEAWNIDTLTYTKALDTLDTSSPLWPIFQGDCQYLYVVDGDADVFIERYLINV